MRHSFPTVVIPFDPARLDAVNAALKPYSELKASRYVNLAAALASAGSRPFVHFMSVVVLPPGRGDPSARLIIEMSVDGNGDEALRMVAEAIPQDLLDILRAAKPVVPSASDLGEYLCSRQLRLDPLWPADAGVMFSGTPDMSVERILAEEKLACRIREILDKADPASAMGKLRAARLAIFQDVEFKWAFVTEPVGIIAGAGPSQKIARHLLRVGRAAIRDGWMYFALPALFTLLCSLVLGSSASTALWHATIAFINTVVAAIVFIAVVLAALRREETADVPVDREPDEAAMAEIRPLEDRHDTVQNHLFGVSDIKDSWVRRFTLRAAMWWIREAGVKGSRPGFLDKIGTIHFARWFRLPGQKRLVFLSNYDGSWQSYLEDFIARLRQGLTTIWSNTKNFPKTDYLFTGGAGDGSRFKRWARRQQQPSWLWYSAYPMLTTARIRTNALIRHGFASASTEQEAACWLAMFGYAGRDSLEMREIPTLAFGGLSRLPFAQCLLVVFPDASDAPRKWLGKLACEVSYGDRMPSKNARVVGFTARGLSRLGLEPAALATFPIAFQEGMVRRARALGDDLDAWTWDPKEVDAALLIYDASQAGLAAGVAAAREAIEEAGCRTVFEIETEMLGKPAFEPFGFRDGISQPAMKGTVRGAREPDPMHTVEPGELVLGYRDNLGKIAPVPEARGQDIGRNGTFLVIRQIQQRKDLFDGYLDAQAAELIACKDPRAPTSDPATLRAWLAAKMVGRWPDGSSLVKYPYEPGTNRHRAIEPDNTFMFGSEDPDGLRCPFGAHVRRANPRDTFDAGSPTQIAISNRHRILRVGRNYLGGNGRVGLLFMCVNADIERQFEFLQQTWMMGPNFHGLDNELDPLLGCNRPGSSRQMLVPTPNGPLRLSGLADFTRVLGGGYFFMPSRSALARLLHGPQPLQWMHAGVAAATASSAP